MRTDMADCLTVGRKQIIWSHKMMIKNCSDYQDKANF